MRADQRKKLLNGLGFTFLVLGFLTLAGTSEGATFTQHETDADVLIIEGDIVPGDCKGLEAYLMSQPSTRLVAIRSPGGLLSEGICMATMVFENDLDTYALKAMSAASIIWLAGERRVLDDHGMVMMHGVTNELGHPFSAWTPEESRDLFMVIGYVAYAIGLTRVEYEILHHASVGEPNEWVSLHELQR